MGKKSKHKSSLLCKRTAATTAAASSRRQALEAAQQRSSSVGSPVSVSRGLKGIMNSGNTCFFNSCLQAINAVGPDLLEFLLHPLTDVGTKPRSDVRDQLVEVIKNLRGVSAKPSINASMLLNALSLRFAQFAGRRQQDAHELFVNLLSVLQEEANPPPASGAESCSPMHTHVDTFADIFTSRLVSVVTCAGCGRMSCMAEDHAAASIDLPGSQALAALPTTRNRGGSKQKDQGSGNKRTDQGSEFAVLANLSADSQSSCGSDSSSVDSTSASSGKSGTDDKVDVTVEIEDEEEGASGGGLQVRQPPPPTPSAVFSAKIPMRCSLIECLDHFTAAEVLSESTGNGYYCDNKAHKDTGIAEGDVCLQHATKRLLFLIPLAPVLVLHLKRLLPGGKISALVDFPEELDMSPYSAHRIATDASSCAALHDADARTTGEEDIDRGRHDDDSRIFSSSQYSLVAVVAHAGSQFGGHYTAFVKHEVASPTTDEGQSYQWYYTSDASVRPVSISEVIQAQAYMLFYRKKPESCCKSSLSKELGDNQGDRIDNDETTAEIIDLISAMTIDEVERPAVNKEGETATTSSNTLDGNRNYPAAGEAEFDCTYCDIPSVMNAEVRTSEVKAEEPQHLPRGHSYHLRSRIAINY